MPTKKKNSGLDTSNADVLASDIMWGKKAYANGVMVIGTHHPPVILVGEDCYCSSGGTSVVESRLFTATGDGSQSILNATNFSMYIYVTPGRTFHFELYARVHGAACSELEMTLGIGTDVLDDSILTPVDDEWEKFEFDGVVPAEASGLYSYTLRAHFASFEAETGSTLQVKNIFLTEWAVEPNDATLQEVLIDIEGTWYDLDIDIKAFRDLWVAGLPPVS